jgi:hypothetical protein
MRTVTAAPLFVALFVSSLLFGCSDDATSSTPALGVSRGAKSQPQRIENAMSLVNPANLVRIRNAGQPYANWVRLNDVEPQVLAGGGEAFVAVQHAMSPYGTSPVVFEYVLKGTVNNVPWTCYVYGPQNQDLIGVDFSNNLWVPQKNVLGQLLTYEYAPYNQQTECTGAPFFTIPDNDGLPGAIAFDRKGGVYILNIINNGGPGTGASIDVYAAGQTSPSTVLQEPKAYMAVGVAVDAVKNVYMSWVNKKNVGHVDMFTGRQNPPVALPMTTGFIGGITFDAAANLLVVDQTAGKIDVFSKPYGEKSSATIQLSGYSVQCTFDRRRAHLYCSDYAQGSIDVYKYSSLNPAATAYQYSWTNGLQPSQMIQGIAISPPASN